MNIFNLRILLIWFLIVISLRIILKKLSIKIFNLKLNIIHKNKENIKNLYLKVMVNTLMYEMPQVNSKSISACV